MSSKVIAGEEFEAARQVCFTGHEAGCTYGGLCKERELSLHPEKWRAPSG